MPQHERAGLVCRLLKGLGSVLTRGTLGKSSHEYMSPFTGSDEYWERAVAAQCRCHERRPSTSDSECWRLSHDGLIEACGRMTTGRSVVPRTYEDSSCLP
jgi:hypothetical protein